MTKGFSEGEAAMLGRFVPPPLAPGFADRVTARLPSEGVIVPKRRDPRGGWRRGRIALVAGVGSALLSVGAAASGILGITVQNMPVIATIAAAVDAPRAKPVAVDPKPVRAALARPKPEVRGQTGERAPPPLVQTQLPEATRLAEQIEARMKRRDARGLGVPSIAMIEARRDRMIARGDPRAETMTAALAILKSREDAGALPAPRSQNQPKRDQWRARMAALSPEQRAVVEARRERRRLQRQEAAETGAAPADAKPAQSVDRRSESGANGQRFRQKWMEMTPEQRAEWRARRDAREATMTPEQRQQLQERRDQRRQQMLRGREGLTGGPEPAPLDTPAPQ